MKLVLARKDYVRCQILSRKISKKHISEKGLERQKIQYYTYLVQYYIHEKMTLDIAKAYQTIYDTFASLPDELDPQGNNRLTSF
jgi:26S proteasome regulatory subunit N5